MNRINGQFVRRQFPLLVGKGAPVYLDSAASSQTPKAVIEAVNGYYRDYRANIHRGLYEASERATARYEESRQLLAGFINCQPEELVFTRGTTESLNLLARVLAPTFGPKDEVVLTVLEHHSNLVPWQQMAKRYGFRVKYIGLNSGYQLDMKQAAQLIGPKTRLVAVSHVSNALGTVMPIRRLAGLAHKAGAWLAVDGAQSIGHRPVDVQRLDCDFLAFSGHKMFGPTGIGALYGRRQLLEKMEPFLYGGDMIERVTLKESSWNELPWKFEAGTPNIAGAIGLGEAVRFIGKLGLEAIHYHERQLADYAIKRLGTIPGVKVYGPPAGKDRGGVVSFGLSGLHPHDLSGILANENVCVRGGHHCVMPLMQSLGLPGTTRASFSVYNTKDDVRLLEKAVRQAKKIFGL